jgi:hypothetical protein
MNLQPGPKKELVSSFETAEGTYIDHMASQIKSVSAGTSNLMNPVVCVRRVKKESNTLHIVKGRKEGRKQGRKERKKEGRKEGRKERSNEGRKAKGLDQNFHRNCLLKHVIEGKIEERIEVT